MLVKICVPPCGCPKVRVTRNGSKVKYDYGKYEVEISSRTEVGERRVEVARQHDFVAPGLAATPARSHQVVGGRGEDIAGRGPDVAPAVAVVINRVSAETRRHELVLTHRSGPGSDHALGLDMAFLEDHEGVEQLASKVGAAPPVIGERGDGRVRYINNFYCIAYIRSNIGISSLHRNVCGIIKQYNSSRRNSRNMCWICLGVCTYRP